MKLTGMAQAFRSSLESGKATQCTADELLAMLIDSEWDQRYNRKLSRSVRMPTSVTKHLLNRLALKQIGRLTKTRCFALQIVILLRRNKM